MRIKRAFFLVFLLVLYIGPSIFTMSYASSATLAEQNTGKEFSISADWYEESWNYRREIDVDTDGDTISAGTNYQIRVPVTYDADMQADFDDIRFTDNDNSTLLDYWCESYIASTSAVFWVEVTDNLDSGGTFYMYYGNATVSSASNGTATFLMYEDWLSESIRTDVWDIVTSDGGVTYNAVGATHGTIAKFDANNGAFSYKITSDYDTSSPIAVMFRSNIEITGAGNTVRQGSGWDGAFAFNLVQSAIGTQIFYVYDDDANQDSQAMDNAYFDDWITYQITRDGTNSKLYADTVLIETASCAPDIITTNPAAFIMVGDAEDDLYSDWVAVRKFDTDEGIFDISVGAEEDNLPDPEWQEAGEAELVFIVPIDETALNWFFIILGMFMVPASTLYLVKGGKNNMSMDKVFYFIVVFLFGWGLIFIGVS